jgi:cobalt-zinc-cadmium efflux system protein
VTELAHRHTPHEPTDVGTRATIPALRSAFAITVTVLVVEAIGGVLTGSIALLADAGHMLTDAGALGIALFGAWLALRPADARRSYGYGRAEILAALANGMLLGGVSVGIVVEAIDRLGTSTDVQAGPMLAIAIVGLAANLVSAWLLAHSDLRNLNVRAALAHVVGDALGSVTAIVAALSILLYDMQVADGIAALVIAALLVATAVRLMRDSVDILLEGAPRDLDVEGIAREMGAVPGVVSVHDLHIWTVAPGFLSMSAHVDLHRGANAEAARRALHRLLHQRYQISHTTIQTEEEADLLTIGPEPPGEAP